MNKKHLVPAGLLVGTLIITGVVGAQMAKAASDTTENFPPMVQKMVEKFNLNKDEVTTMLAENRTDRQTENKAAFEKTLTEAVTAGKITESQKAAILVKHDELQVKREALRDTNQANREGNRTEMQALRTEMQNFLKDQGVDESVLPTPKGPQGGGMRMGGGMHRGNNI